MEIRITKPEEQEQVATVEAVAFISEVPEKQEYSGCTWGCFSDTGDLNSVVTNWPYHVHYNGKVVKMGGIGGVASLPEARMQGGVRGLISEILRRDQEEGVVFSTLYPFSHTYYRQYGYEICSTINVVQFPTTALAKYRHYVTEISMVNTLEDAMKLSSLNEKFSKKYNMSVQRNEFSWKGFLRWDYKKAEGYRYALSKDGKPIAYVFFQSQEMHAYVHRLCIKDFAYDGREGLYALLGFFYKLSAQYKMLSMEVPPDFPIDSLIDEPYDVDPGPHYTRWMARLVDVEAGLSGLCCPQGDWKCTIKLRDDYMPHNSGVYQLVHTGEELEVIKVQGEDVDLSVSIQTLTQLCLGYLSLDMALLREDVELHGNKELLSKLFTQRPIYMIDKF